MTVQFEMRIKSSNAAFKENAEYEVARLLRETASRVLAGDAEGSVRDINGTAVGDFWLHCDEDEP